jgi:hypothetical protein
MFSADKRDEYDSPDAIDVLDHMGVPEEEGRYYKIALQHGGVLLTIEGGQRRTEALSILRSNHAITGENFKSEALEGRPAAVQDAGQGRVELLGETLRINKERV